MFKNNKFLIVILLTIPYGFSSQIQSNEFTGTTAKSAAVYLNKALKTNNSKEIQFAINQITNASDDIKNNPSVKSFLQLALEKISRLPQPADQDDSGLASGDINIPVTPLSQSVTPPSQDADQLSNDGDGISQDSDQSASSSQQNKDQGFVSGVPTPMPATPPAIKPIAPVMPGPVITPTRIKEPMSKPIDQVTPTPATIVPAAPKGQDNFPPVPPTPTPAPMFNGNTFNQPQSGSTSTGNTPPPAPIFNNSTGKFDEPQSGTSPLPGTPGIVTQTDAQYPYLDQFNKLKAPKGLNELKKQIDDSLKINVKTVLDDEKSTQNLEVFLTTSSRELKKVDSIRSMKKTYNNINLSENYIELLELVDNYSNSIHQLQRILASSKKINKTEAIDAAQKWVESSKQYSEVIEEDGDKVLTETKDQNKMLETMNDDAKGTIDDLTSLKNTYMQSLDTLKRQVNIEFSSDIQSAQIAIYEMIASIMFAIQKHRLSNHSSKDEFLSNINDYKQSKVKKYINSTDIFKADSKIMEEVLKTYKEIMESNKEINPGDVAILFSSEEQQKLAELDTTNSLIRVMNIHDKIKIQRSESYAAIKSVKKDSLISKAALDAKLYTVNKESAGIVNIGLKQKISDPSLAQIALGYTAKIVAADYDADDNALIAFVGPAVANPLVDICIMPETDDRNNVIIYINTNPLFETNLDSATPGKIKELLFRTESPLLQGFNDHGKNFDKEIADIKVQFTRMQRNGLKDPAQDEYMLYIITKINKTKLEEKTTPQHKTSKNVIEKILYRVQGGK